jgi:hypothetical protein
MHSRILPSIDDIRLRVGSPTINQISSSPKKKTKTSLGLHETSERASKKQQSSKSSNLLRLLN